MLNMLVFFLPQLGLGQNHAPSQEATVYIYTFHKNENYCFCTIPTEIPLKELLFLHMVWNYTLK